MGEQGGDGHNGLCTYLDITITESVIAGEVDHLMLRLLLQSAGRYSKDTAGQNDAVQVLVVLGKVLPKPTEPGSLALFLQCVYSFKCLRKGVRDLRELLFRTHARLKSVSDLA